MKWNKLNAALRVFANNFGWSCIQTKVLFTCSDWKEDCVLKPALAVFYSIQNLHFFDVISVSSVNGQNRPL